MGIRDSERGVKGKVKGEKRIVKNKGREERNPPTPSQLINSKETKKRKKKE